MNAPRKRETVKRSLREQLDRSEGLFAETGHYQGLAEMPTHDADRMADCVYSRTISAMVQHGTVVGTRFHPEKNGEMRLKIIGNFLRR